MHTQTQTPTFTGVNMWTPIVDSSTNGRSSDNQLAATTNNNKDDEDGALDRRKKKGDLETNDKSDGHDTPPSCCNGRCFCDYISYFLSTFLVTFGMVTFMALYILIGAYIFLSIEQDAELQMLKQHRNHHYDTELNVTRELVQWMLHGGGCNSSSRRDIEREVRGVLHAYTETVWKNQWRGEVQEGQDISVENLNWQLLPAYIFCMSIVTTIGYGNIVPNTRVGRVVTIIYAIIGIPCTAICLSHFGSMAATCVKFMLYKSRQCRGKGGDESSSDDDDSDDTTIVPEQKRKITFSDNVTNNSGSFSRLDVDLSKDHSSESFSSVPNFQKTLPAKSPTEEQSIPEVSTLALHDTQSRNLSVKESRNLYLLSIPAKTENSTTTPSILSKKRQKSPPKSARTFDTDDIEDVEVPVYVSAILLIVYVFIGGVIFSEWKGENWDFLTGFYFSFITLSTIGFGDYVFGDHVSGDDEVGEVLNDAELIFTGFYIFFGLGFLSMCIDLMHKSISRTITEIRLGFWARMDRYSKENKHRQRKIRRLRKKLNDANRRRRHGKGNLRMIDKRHDHGRRIIVKGDDQNDDRQNDHSEERRLFDRRNDHREERQIIDRQNDTNGERRKIDRRNDRNDGRRIVGRRNDQNDDRRIIARRKDRRSDSRRDYASGSEGSDRSSSLDRGHRDEEESRRGYYYKY